MANNDSWDSRLNSIGNDWNDTWDSAKADAGYTYSKEGVEDSISFTQASVSNSLSNVKSDSEEYIDNVKNQITNGGTNIENSAKSVINGIATIGDTTQYDSLGKSVVTSASNVARKYVEQYLSYFTTTVPVSVGTIMGTIAPYAADFDSASSAVVENTKKLTKKLSNIATWNIPAEVLNDSEVQESMSNLSIVQSYAGTLETISNGLSLIQSIVNVITPLLPIVRIVSNLALSYWSGGTTTSEAAADTTETTEKYALQLLSVAMYYIKKYFYNIQIKVPKFLTIDDVNVLNVKSAAGQFDMDDNTSIGWSLLFNDDFYTTAMIENKTSTYSNTVWIDELEESYKDYKEELSSKIATAYKLGYSSSNPNSWWNRYKNKFVTNFMSKAVRQAKTSIYSNKYDNFDSYFNSINGSSYTGIVNAEDNLSFITINIEKPVLSIIKDSNTIFINM